MAFSKFNMRFLGVKNHNNTVSKFHNDYNITIFDIKCF